RPHTSSIRDWSSDVRSPDLRISTVETLSLGTSWRDFSYVRITTDEGLVGIGEITHPFRGAETCALARNMGERHLVGADPFDTEEDRKSGVWGKREDVLPGSG